MSLDFLASSSSKRTGSKTVTVATATAVDGKVLDGARQMDATDGRASSGGGASDSIASKADGTSTPTSLDKEKAKRGSTLSWPNCASCLYVPDD
ncbi:hypothetical protein Ancab_023418 [Ancistrocladus abbreviatus]